MNYQDENDSLTRSFLDRTFFKAWKDPECPAYGNYNRVELFFNTSCNLKCKYCYLANYGEQLYPKAPVKQTLENLDMFLDWLIKNEFYPTMEFFSGEPLVQKSCMKALHMVLDKFEAVDKRPARIVIPTNFTFILSDTQTQAVEELLNRSRGLKMPILLSASFDGKFVEANRPFQSGIEPRDDAYYEKAFDFAKKWHCGFHPMVYSEEIEKWKDNWLWFQENFKKRDISFFNIYLLEVRNSEWSLQQTKELSEFVRWLIEWTWDLCNRDLKTFFDCLFARKGYNILNSPLSQIGRGIGCSIQSLLTVRLGDLTMVPCHRTSYAQNVLARFSTSNGEITGVKSINPEQMIGIYTFSANTFPICDQCVIRSLCSKGCLGSQLETTGDMFTPIPTVCLMEFAKIKGMIQGYENIGIYHHVIGRVSKEKRTALKLLRRWIHE